MARELERRWEEALKAAAAARGRVRAVAAVGPRPALAPTDEQAIRALAADLPAVWPAATTTPADRQRIARLLLERVVVTVDKASERVDVSCTGSAALVRVAHPAPGR